MNSIQNSFQVARLAVLISFFALSCKSVKTADVADHEAEQATKELETLIRQQKEVLLKKREDELRKMDEEIIKRNAMIESPKKLVQYFDAIATAGNTSTINNTLALFASSNVPVLVIIHDKNGKKNYTRTLTISAYLIYLKGQKRYMDHIEHLAVNNEGKITELELAKSELQSTR